MAIALSEREPHVTPEQIVAALVPPPTFSAVSFDSYRPDPAEPSQAAALDAARVFTAAASAPSSRRGLLRRVTPPSGPTGLYLDGGFGVGKTHLLASIWHASPGPKLFATFIELTHLTGALGFAHAVERLAEYRLICIDEFELDDPGDTVLVSSLLGKLADRGVRMVATSNTLPGSLGEGRFAAEDFLREIQALASRFSVTRIDGPDFRHRDIVRGAPLWTEAEVAALAGSRPDASHDHFVDLCRNLERLHPSRYGALVEGVGLVCLTDVRQLTDQSTALRLVVLVDRLYDRGVPVVASGWPLDQVFAADMLSGGHRKKYARSLSRLSWCSHQGERVRES